MLPQNAMDNAMVYYNDSDELFRFGNSNVVNELNAYLSSVSSNDLTVQKLRSILGCYGLNRMQNCLEGLHKSWSSSIALVIVDMQNDFITGSLKLSACPAKQDPLKIIGSINSLTRMSFTMCITTQDWHPMGHISFYENRCNFALSPTSPIQDLSKVNVYDTVVFLNEDGSVLEQKLYPKHCVIDTEGAALHKDLILPENCHSIKKGRIENVESNSTFGYPPEDSGLHDLLKNAAIKTVVFCGVATDVCIAYSVFAALEKGFYVIVVQDACCGIWADSIAEVYKEMRQRGVYLTTVSEIPKLLTGEYIPRSHIRQLFEQSGLTAD